jgi:hypothetical protein
LENRESKENLAIPATTDSRDDGENLDLRVAKEYLAEVDHADLREHADQLVRREMLDHLDHREK